jgi:hypothetical protein
MTTQRHHYVPQGYLRGFAAEEDSSRSFVWVYAKAPGRAPRKKSVRSIAWAPAYYAQENPDGTEDADTFETHLAKTIDNTIPQILRSIAPQVGQCVGLSEDDKGALAFFVGFSLTRVPSFRDGINDMYTQIAKIGLSHPLEADPELKNFAEKYGVTASAKEWVSMRPMVEMAHAIATSALTKNWQFFVPPLEVPLVTSDNPVVFSGKAAGLDQSVGPAHPLAELVMNLRTDLALVCTPKQGYPSTQVFRLTPSEARKFNRGIVGAARQRVFAGHYSERFDAFVKKYAGKEQRIIV